MIIIDEEEVKALEARARHAQELERIARHNMAEINRDNKQEANKLAVARAARQKFLEENDQLKRDGATDANALIIAARAHAAGIEDGALDHRILKLKEQHDGSAAAVVIEKPVLHEPREHIRAQLAEQAVGIDHRHHMAG
jgi:hypothetical protein